MAGASAGSGGVESWHADHGGRAAGILKREVRQVADAGRFCLRQRPAAYVDGKAAQNSPAETICGVEVEGVGSSREFRESTRIKNRNMIRVFGVDSRLSFLICVQQRKSAATAISLRPRAG